MTDRTIQGKRDPDYLAEMSDYLNALANPTRLQILAHLENHPMELKEITALTKTSYENIRKHIDKLVLAGVVRKDAGMSSETMTGIHPVWKYSLSPGGMEAIVTKLSMFSKVPLTVATPDLADQVQMVRGEIVNQFGRSSPCLYLTGGPDEGKIYPLTAEKTAVGRKDPVGESILTKNKNVILSPEYKSVSRVSRPHCYIYHEDGFFIEDCVSTSGTFVNTEPLTANEKRPLEDGDLIILGSGNFSAKLIFLSDS